jgi:hypothetical protein
MKEIHPSIDQGTTSSRAIIFDESARIVAQAQEEVHCAYPHPGWVEQDPLEIWSSVSATVNEALIKSNLGMRHIAAIGIPTNGDHHRLGSQDRDAGLSGHCLAIASIVNHLQSLRRQEGFDSRKTVCCSTRISARRKSGSFSKPSKARPGPKGRIAVWDRR